MKIRPPLSSLMCSIESGDPNGGGGGGDALATPDEPTSPTSDPAPSVPSAEDIAAKVLESITPKMQEIARNSYYAEQRRNSKGKAKSEPAPPPAQEPTPSQPQIDRAMERRFDRALGNAEYELNDKRIEVLERDLAADMPDDVGAWMAERVKDYGWFKPQPEQPKAQEPAVEPKPDPEPKPPPQSPNGAPSALPSLDQFRAQFGVIDVFSLPEDVQLTMPIDELKAEFEKAASVSRQASGAPPIPAVLRRSAGK